VLKYYDQWPKCRSVHDGILKLVLDKEDDVQLQIEATRAIENMGEVASPLL